MEEDIWGQPYTSACICTHPHIYVYVPTCMQTYMHPHTTHTHKNKVKLSFPTEHWKVINNNNYNKNSENKSSRFGVKIPFWEWERIERSCLVSRMDLGMFCMIETVNLCFYHVTGLWLFLLFLSVCLAYYYGQVGSIISLVGLDRRGWGLHNACCFPWAPQKTDKLSHLSSCFSCSRM